MQMILYCLGSQGSACTGILGQSMVIPRLRMKVTLMVIPVALRFFLYVVYLFERVLLRRKEEWIVCVCLIHCCSLPFGVCFKSLAVYSQSW